MDTTKWTKFYCLAFNSPVQCLVLQWYSTTVKLLLEDHSIRGPTLICGPNGPRRPIFHTNADQILPGDRTSSWSGYRNKEIFQFFQLSNKKIVLKTFDYMCYIAFSIRSYFALFLSIYTHVDKHIRQFLSVL